MNTDYYRILKISSSASQKEIARAYRNLSLKWHPKISKADPNETYHKFCDIAEAYEVLSNPERRSFYDQHDEKNLKEGIITEKNELIGGYRFNGNPEEIFEKFFGSNNPYPQLFEGDTIKEFGSLITDAFGIKTPLKVEQVPDLIVYIKCTLNELYNGCKREISYERQILNADERTTSKITEKKEVEIKRGYNKNTDILFAGMGNQECGLPNSNLIFKIKEIPHHNYQRKGDNLIYFAKISLSEALNAESISFITLDGRKIFVSNDKIISPQTIIRVLGEGMPIYNKDEYLVENYNKPLNKGNLEVQFDIEFPKSLSVEQKKIIKNLLGDQMEE